MEIKYKDFSGQQFKNVTAVSYVKSTTYGKAIWLLKCKCGVEFEGVLDHFKNGKSHSCKECTYISRSTKCRDNATKHGMKHTPEYGSWQNMRRRCYSPSHDTYSFYGGRGISVCDSWLNSFNSFIEDMGRMPDDGIKYSIDRIDCNGNYEPSNCKWSVHQEQVRNQRVRKNNNTGVAGVRLVHDGAYYLASWTELDGKEKTKCFNISKLGKDEAFRLACEMRHKMSTLMKEKLNKELYG